MGAMSDDAALDEQEALREAEEVRRRRAERDAALTPSQRLERVHELCRQLAAIEPASEEQ